MKKTRFELKSDAKNMLQGRWLMESVIALVVSLISYAIPIFMAYMSPFFGSFIGRLLIVPLSFGFARRFVLLNRGVESELMDLFHFYDAKYLPTVIIASLISSITVGLLSILLIVPGVIAYYHYVLCQYILTDYPNLSHKEVLTKSSRMMGGYKIDYLTLQLSFIGWSILASITVIGVIPLIVYKQATFATFYNELRDTYEGIQEDSLIDEPFTDIAPMDNY